MARSRRTASTKMIRRRTRRGYPPHEPPALPAAMPSTSPQPQPPPPPRLAPAAAAAGVAGGRPEGCRTDRCRGCGRERRLRILAFGCEFRFLGEQWEDWREEENPRFLWGVVGFRSLAVRDRRRWQFRN